MSKYTAGFWITGGIILLITSGITGLSTWYVKDSFYQTKYNAIVNESGDPKTKTISLTSGKIEKGSWFCWNNDIKISRFDVEPNHDIKIWFDDSPDPITFKPNQVNKPIKGSKGILNIKIYEPKATMTLEGGDSFVFESTYELLTNSIDTNAGES